MSAGAAVAVVAPQMLTGVLDPASGEVTPELVAWVEERYGTLRGPIARTAQDLVAIGRILGEVKGELAPGEFLAFVAALGISRSTAYRWIAAAEAAAGCSRVENVEPTALYALAAKSTPEEIRAGFLRRADAGEPVTLQAVQAVLRERRGAEPPPAPNHPERVVDAVAAAEAAGAGTDWRGRDARAKRIGRELERFVPELRPEVAAAADAWGRALVAAAAPFLANRQSSTG